MNRFEALSRIASFRRATVSGAGAARRATAAIAATTAAAIALSLAPTPALAVSADERENLSTVQDVAAPVFAAADHRLPAIETLLGRGAPLAADPAGRVALGDQASTATSALVRVTALEPGQDTAILTAADSPVLRAAAGTTASATALLPVTEGAVPLWADAPAAVRVEPLAFFAGGENAPGATVALAEPVRRADTRAGLAGPALASDPIWIGVTGAGGVPASGVRSAYLALDVEFPAAGALVLGDGQELALPAGRSVVTTVVTLDERGGITAAVPGAGAPGHLVADVQGFASEVAMDHERANGVGSYVSTTETNDPITKRISAGRPATGLPLADHADVEFALALVAAAPDAGSGAASGTTTLTGSAELRGRAAGVAVDAAAGALPQLALVPVEEGTADLGIRRGSAALTVQPLGGFLGEPVEPPHADGQAPEIAITSPLHRADIDVSETGVFTLAGTVAAGANAIDRIEISSPSVGFIGNAEIVTGDDGMTWEFTAAAPDDGDFDYVASVFDRGDPGTAQASDRVTLTVTTPDEDDAVVSPEVRVFNTDPAALDFTVESPTRVVFAASPDVVLDTIIVSGPTEQAPAGFSGRVRAIDRTAAGWVVDTVEVTMEEMFYQFDLDTTLDYDEGVGEDGKPIVVDALPDTRPAEETLTGEFAIADDSGAFGDPQPIEEVAVEDGTAAEHADLMLGDDVDLELNADDMDAAYAEDFALGCRPSGGAGEEPTGAEIDENGEWIRAGGSGGATTGCDDALQRGVIEKTWSLGLEAKLLIEYRKDKLAATNLTKEEQEAAAEKRRQALETGAAATIDAQAQASLSLRIVFDVKFSFKWKVIPTGVTVNDFRVQVTTNIKANASLEIALFREQSFKLKQDLAKLYLPTTVFMVGAVPVTITNELEISLGIESAIKAAVKLPLIGIEREDTFGFTYSTNSGLARIKNDPVTTYVDPALKPIGSAEGVKFSLGGEVTVGPAISYSSKVYGFAGPQITLSAGAGIEGEASMTVLPDRTTLAASLDVFVGAGLVGQAKLKLVKWQLLSVKLFELKWRYSLFSKEWETDL